MSARHRIPQLTEQGAPPPRLCGAPSPARCATSPLRRWLYSTDASSYRVVPDVVLVAGLPGRPPRRRRGGARARRARRRRAAPRRAWPARPSARASRSTASGWTASSTWTRADARRACEPGVIQASLNAAAAPHGLEFGPDTSTVDQATIGGMVGNNSSGSRSIVYGESKDKVLGVDAVLAGGERRRLRRLRRRRPRRGLRGPAAERLAAALAQVRERYREPIATGLSRRRGAAPRATTCASCSRPSPTWADCSPARRARSRCSPSSRCCSTRARHVASARRSRSPRCTPRSRPTSRSSTPGRRRSSCSTSSRCAARPT